MRAITTIDDFTLALDPAYSDTNVETRELVQILREEGKEDNEDKKKLESSLRENVAKQVSEMRHAAKRSIV